MIDKNILIAECSPEALHKLADQYLFLSQDLRAAAERKAVALGRDKPNERRTAELAKIPDLVAGYVAGGMTAEAAIRAAAIAAGVEDETVMAWVRHRRREIDRGQREANRARVLALSEQGFSIRKIAAKVHVPRSTVGRWVAGISMQPDVITSAAGRSLRATATIRERNCSHAAPVG